MKNKIFGSNTGLRVSEIALGTGNFGTRWGHGASEEDSKNIFENYIEAGGNFIDTADGYQVGESEEILGRLIAGHRNNLVLASKYSMGGNNIQTMGNSRKNMIYSIEASLKRLKTDRLDIYWAHLSDGQTPIEEIMRAFDDLIRDGKVLYPGFSNFPAWRIASASTMSALKGWSPIAGIQIEYNLLERTADRELLPMAEAHGLGTAFWSPLGGGTLTGKYRDNQKNPDSRKEAWGTLIKDDSGQREIAILNLLDKIAKEKGAEISHIALAWIRQKNDNTQLSTVTIIGPRNTAQLQDNLASLKVVLTNEEIVQLNELSAVKLGSPHEIIAGSRDRNFGAGSGLIDIKQNPK